MSKIMSKPQTESAEELAAIIADMEPPTEAEIRAIAEARELGVPLADILAHWRRTAGRGTGKTVADMIAARQHKAKVDGLGVNADAARSTLLPEPWLPPPAVDEAALLSAWRELQSGSPLWLALGLARFAGLRRDEISAMQRGWIVQRGSTVLVELRDRPEDGWWTKTGKPYLAPVIDGDLAAALIAAPPGAIIQTPPDITRDVWFLRTPQRWLKARGITAHKPLHRLRGLYADDVARVTADAVAARLAGVSAAQAALGHTSSDTTERHYLTAPQARTPDPRDSSRSAPPE